MQLNMLSPLDIGIAGRIKIHVWKLFKKTYNRHRNEVWCMRFWGTKKETKRNMRMDKIVTILICLSNEQTFLHVHTTNPHPNPKTMKFPGKQCTVFIECLKIRKQLFCGRVNFKVALEWMVGWSEWMSGHMEVLFVDDVADLMPEWTKLRWCGVVFNGQ